MASYLYIENGAKIKPQSGSNYVADASNISGLYNGQTKDLAYIIEQLESRIANASFTPTLDSGEQKLLWFNGSVPSSITNGSTGTLTKGRCFAKYGDYYKEVTSSTNLTFKASAGSISGTTITPPTVSSGTQSVNVWAEYKEGTITQTSSSKSYTAKANVSYYWYAGTTAVDGNNYTSVASQVQTIPSSSESILNNEYLYIVAPKTKTITVLDANTNAVVNMKTYNQDTGTFTNAETFVGDYKIYKSAQDGLGRFIINVN